MTRKVSRGFNPSTADKVPKAAWSPADGYKEHVKICPPSVAIRGFPASHGRIGRDTLVHVSSLAVIGFDGISVGLTDKFERSLSYDRQESQGIVDQDRSQSHI